MAKRKRAYQYYGDFTALPIAPILHEAKGIIPVAPIIKSPFPGWMPKRLPKWSYPLFFGLLVGPMMYDRAAEDGHSLGDAVDVKAAKVEKTLIRAFNGIFKKHEPWVLAYHPPTKQERPIKTNIEVKEPSAEKLAELGIELQ